ncbi:hypothetical protein IVB30_34675 [Bradyrhizobium sp. 200]|uniref:hypothetical protein n=1 Tax=Bradyrhizobium sp. 200 TaxID=2782665 RepID=UPI001FFF7674|nr:hypothetical protein [Bradyrhizobium sp. 200]UPJ54668.1 hypothetical protein IVB30_34675 [Bradyrhizobium sp. 200]
MSSVPASDPISPSRYVDVLQFSRAIGGIRPGTRLRAAGAVVIGKTQTTELAFSALDTNPTTARDERNLA